MVHFQEAQLALGAVTPKVETARSYKSSVESREISYWLISGFDMRLVLKRKLKAYM